MMSDERERYLAKTGWRKEIHPRGNHKWFNRREAGKANYKLEDAFNLQKDIDRDAYNQRRGPKSAISGAKRPIPKDRAIKAKKQGKAAA